MTIPYIGGTIVAYAENYVQELGQMSIVIVSTWWSSYLLSYQVLSLFTDTYCGAHCKEHLSAEFAWYCLPAWCAIEMCSLLRIKMRSFRAYMIKFVVRGVAVMVMMKALVQLVEDVSMPEKTM